MDAALDDKQDALIGGPGVVIDGGNHEITQKTSINAFRPINFKGASIVAVGDSIVRGSATKPSSAEIEPETHSYVNILSQYLGGGTVTNYAQNGGRMGTAYLQLYNNINSASTPDIVWIGAGVNDFLNQMPIGEFGQDNYETFYGITTKLCKYLKNTSYFSASSVVFVTPIPVRYPHASNNPANYPIRLNEYNDVIYKVATYYGFNVIDGFSLGMPMQRDFWAGLMTGDCVHPTIKGYEFIANTLYGRLSGVADVSFGPGEGNYSVIQLGSNNRATGDYSFVNGKDNVAQGSQTHAEGLGTVAINAGSHAEGGYTYAVGTGSHAEGAWTYAIGNFSHAEGLSTSALTDYSHTEGGYTTASRIHSHAEGERTKAMGISSHAEGGYTTAGGGYSHAEGYETKATGSSSHAEGSGAIAAGGSSHAEGSGAIASGSSSHAEGFSTIASGNSSHAEGFSTTASGEDSHAEGVGTTASGNHSHAEGNSTTALGSDSHAEGNYTTAKNVSEHAEGQYNVSNSATTTYGSSGNTQHSVGIGPSYSNRKNAFEIMQNGDVYIIGIGGYNGTNAAQSGVKTLQQILIDAGLA